MVSPFSKCWKWINEEASSFLTKRVFQQLFLRRQEACKVVSRFVAGLLAKENLSLIQSLEISASSDMWPKECLCHHAAAFFVCPEILKAHKKQEVTHILLSHNMGLPESLLNWEMILESSLLSYLFGSQFQQNREFIHETKTSNKGRPLSSSLHYSPPTMDIIQLSYYSFSFLSWKSCAFSKSSLLLGIWNCKLQLVGKLHFLLILFQYTRQHSTGCHSAKFPKSVQEGAIWRQ